jgi:hypothetical protein
METNRIKKAIAILLVVLFLVTVTAGAASAAKKADAIAYSATHDKITQELSEKNSPIKKQGFDDTSRKTVTSTMFMDGKHRIFIMFG